MTKALLAAFEAHPVGRLRLSPRTFAPGEPVEFLGHCLTPCEEGVRIEITDANKRKFEDRMKSKLRSLAKTKRQRARRKALHDIKQDIRSWADAFTLCDDTQKIRSYWLARLHWQFKEGPDSAFDEKETMNNTVYKTFKLHPDQKEIVEQHSTTPKQHRHQIRYRSLGVHLPGNHGHRYRLREPGSGDKCRVQESDRHTSVRYQGNHPSRANRRSDIDGDYRSVTVSVMSPTVKGRHGLLAPSTLIGYGLGEELGAIPIVTRVRPFLPASTNRILWDYKSCSAVQRFPCS